MANILPTRVEHGTTNPYDAVPYPSHAFAATAPDRLATIGSLFGLCPPDTRRARVLELGSSSGGNIIGHAATYPDAQVLGLDLSERQVALGQQTIAELGLRNAHVAQADLTTWRPEPGAWDYIICHGVYSWVSPEVQKAILQICQQGLSPQGIAVVSWNANPGWHVQAMIRDAMQYLVDPSTSLGHQAARGQDVIRVLSSIGRHSDSPHAKMLDTITTHFELLPNSYVAHEYMEPHNQPLYLAEFTRHLASAGLRYLADSNPGHALPQLHEPALQQRLMSLAKGQIAMEQYMDFLTCRPFHTSLLTRADAPVQRDLNRFDPSTLWLSRSQPLSEQEQQTQWPLASAFLEAVHAAWPRPIPFADAAAQAAEVVISSHDEATSRRMLIDTALTSFLQGKTALHRHGHDHIQQAGTHPRAWFVARYQAQRHHLVSNLWHNTIALDPLDLLLLEACDGTRDRAELTEHLRPMLAHHQELRLGAEQPLHEQLMQRLEGLSAQGFFVS